MAKLKRFLIVFLILLTTLTAVLFGAVFRVKKQSVIALGEDVEYCQNLQNEILKSANIKNGKSIFMIDKEKSIENIEKTHPYIKVVQIKTTSLTSIEIKVRKRFEMYYSEVNGKFFVLDEDLKILRISEIKPEVTNLNANLNITNNTKVGDFVGSNFYKQVAYNLFVALYTNAGMERVKINSFINSVSFDEGYCLTEQYNRLILETSSGVEMDICKPTTDLNQKINICFSAYNHQDFTAEQKSSGVIKIYLDENGNQKVGYFND